MPRMPFRGVRNSWLTVARKRDFATLAASARLRASSRGARGLDAGGDVGPGPQPVRVAIGPRHGHLDEGEPARRPGDRGEAHLAAAHAVRPPIRRTVLDHLDLAGRAEERQGLPTDEAPIALVGEGDAAQPIPLYDDLGGGLHEGAVALLALREAPDPVLQMLDARLGARLRGATGRPRDTRPCGEARQKARSAGTSTSTRSCGVMGRSLRRSHPPPSVPRCRVGVATGFRKVVR